MNKSTIIGLVLIFGIMMGYFYLMQPSKEEIQKEKARQDSLITARKKEAAYRDSLIRIERDSIAQLPDSLRPKMDVTPARPAGTLSPQDLAAPFGHALQADTSNWWIESDVLRIRLSAKGGRPADVELTQYKTFDTLPLMLFREKGSTFSLSFFQERQRVETGKCHFTPVWYDNTTEGTDSIVMKGDRLKFGMRLYMFDSVSDGAQNPYIEFVYTLTRGSYMVGFEVVMKGMQDYVAPQTEQLDLAWTAELQKQEKTTNVMNGSTVYYAHADREVEYLSESKDDEMSVPTKVKWLSFKQAFFTAVLIAGDHFTQAEASVSTDKKSRDPRYVRSVNATLGVPYTRAEETRIPLQFYFGPNKFKTLKQYDLGMERQIPLGWSFFLMHWINRFAVLPVFNWLENTGMNYGIIILILTLLLKLALFPIAYKTYVSSAKMRALKPEVDEITKKFPKKEDAMKKQQATMALYKSVGVNPMAGCVPQLLQFPILLAMFRFFPASFELRQQSFLWATDLSSYDSILNLPFKIPGYGDHVSLFTLLMTISTIIYTRINNQMMSGTQQMPGMKLMMYLMPIMFLGIFNSYSSGLSYYYLLANLITFAQIFIIRRFVDENKLRAQLQANKQKPVKKSRFQQRLEEAAKQRGYKPVKK
ncbi:MAG TPA: membrane protein insertase YidC [Bacteroidales bacterium]|nr:membrane protein insertase YidC [Bacteroidales bacterium]